MITSISKPKLPKSLSYPLTAALIAASSLISGCSTHEQKAKPADIHGTWELDSKNLRSDTYTVDDFRGFAVNIHPDGNFSAAGIPSGQFLNKGPGKADFKGTWKLRYDGYNYIDFTIKNLPGYTSGHYSRPIEWKDSRRVIRLSGNDFVYIVRTRNSGEQTP
ncbi:MAG: hypothetical protein EOP88_22010 [Verrucomicrobiaceae bacterium]|nr:MAG: hypothetical protein EOP88_22010 [Verrucomicrobiaceae bacterium]